ncbi:MAG TPA: hypothetical protein VIL48_11630 [Acidimicrobiales bacterium]
MLDPITDLVRDEGFRTGLAFGLGAAAVAGIAALLARPVRPWAGFAFGAAALAALADRIGDADRGPVTAALVVGLALLAAAGVAGAHPALRLAAAVPGAVVVAGSTEIDSPGWAAPAVVIAAVVGGGLAAACDRTWGRRGLPPVLLAVTVLGVYATTPDTEHARVLAGAALAVALLGWPRPLASLGAGGSLVAAALVGWTAVVDGMARPGAVVGAIACLGVLALEPVVRWGVGRLAPAPTSRAPGSQVPGPQTPGSAGPDRRAIPAAPARPAPWGRDAAARGLVHLGLVAACSRVAGLRTSAVQAGAISVAAYAAAAAVLVALERQRRADAPGSTPR